MLISMKKTIISFIVFTAIILNSNAQVFIGGDFSTQLSGGKTKSGSNSVDQPSTATFRLSPKVGFFLNDDFAIGAEVLLGISTTNDKATPTETKTTGASWGIAPFARYSVAEMGKFSVLLEGTAGISGTTTKSKTGSSSVDLPSTLTIGLGVTPMLSYNLSNKINLELGLDFLSFDLSRTTRTTKVSGGDDIKNHSTNFGLGVDSNNVFTNNLGTVTIGFIFKL